MRRMLVLFLLLAGCARQATVSGESMSDDIAIYRAVIDSIFVRGQTERGQVLVRDSSFSVPNGTSPIVSELAGLPGSDSATVRDFVSRNAQSVVLSELSSLQLAKPVRLLAASEIKSLGDHPITFWEKFHTKYPQSAGYVVLSSIGYNADRSVAVLVVDSYCGSLCAAGRVVSLRRVNGEWRITAVNNVWVS